MMFSRYFFVFSTIIDRVNYILFNQQKYVYQIHLMARDVYTIILQQLHIFTVSFILVINRCWCMVTSNLDNFAWITSSVSI